LKHNFSNCYQCIAYKECYGKKTPADLNEAKDRANTCKHPYKGLGTDLISILNTPKRISLRKAYRFAKQGKVTWEGFHLVKFLNEN